MADFLFTREFIEQLAAIEKIAPQRELRLLEVALASIARNPERSDRFPTTTILRVQRISFAATLF